MKAGYKLIDRLIANPEGLNLLALNKVLTLGIAFNAPHGFKLKRVTDEEVVVACPNRKLNHNHIGGIHACAMATVGEFAAGVSILKSFGISRYRIIMTELQVSFHWQGKTDLEGIASPSAIDKEAVRSALEAEGIYTQPMETIIREVRSGKEVARVKTTWQLKSWDKVKTKV
jgi:acyl-coenzyme A thioesterase PaaI-like protein